MKQNTNFEVIRGIIFPRRKKTWLQKIYSLFSQQAPTSIFRIVFILQNEDGTLQMLFILRPKVQHSQIHFLVRTISKDLSANGISSSEISWESCAPSNKASVLEGYLELTCKLNDLEAIEIIERGVHPQTTIYF